MEFSWTEVIVFGVVVFLIFRRMASLTMEIEKLKSRASDCEIQLPDYEVGQDDTLARRLENLEYCVFGRSGRDIDVFHNRVISNRLSHLEDRVKAGARYLQLNHTDDEMEQDFDGVCMCIRSAAYQMLKEAE